MGDRYHIPDVSEKVRSPYNIYHLPEVAIGAKKWLNPQQLLLHTIRG